MRRETLVQSKLTTDHLFFEKMKENKHKISSVKLLLCKLKWRHSQELDIRSNFEPTSKQGVHF